MTTREPPAWGAHALVPTKARIASTHAAIVSGESASIVTFARDMSGDLLRSRLRNPLGFTGKDAGEVDVPAGGLDDLPGLLGPRVALPAPPRLDGSDLCAKQLRGGLVADGLDELGE